MHTYTCVDPYFSRASPLDQQDLLLFCEKLVSEKSESPLILFYFERENKTRKKTLKKSDSRVFEKACL